MPGWLLKTEPFDYSFADLLRQRRAVWDGVSNSLARQYLRAMRKGDEAFIYHTGKEKAIVGLAQVVSDPYSPGGAESTAEVVIDLVPLHPLARPLTLAEMKASADFAGFELLRLPRLSVMPVPPHLWRLVLQLAGQ